MIYSLNEYFFGNTYSSMFILKCLFLDKYPSFYEMSNPVRWCRLKINRPQFLIPLLIWLSAIPQELYGAFQLFPGEAWGRAWDSGINKPIIIFRSVAHTSSYRQRSAYCDREVSCGIKWWRAVKLILRNCLFFVTR